MRSLLTRSIPFATISCLSLPIARAEFPRGVYVRVPEQASEIFRSRFPSRRILYLNHNGGTFVGTKDGSWEENASLNRSSLFRGTRSLSRFPFGEESWNQVVRCVREIMAPFDIDVVEQDPGGVAHIEVVVTTEARIVGMPDNVAGVAPYRCRPFNSAIVYTFAQAWGNSPRSICETAVQETAHAFSLDHEFYCPDPMTYLSGCGDKTFQDVDVPCGEYKPRPCECGGSFQNSYQSLRSLLGLRPPTPMSVHVVTPLSGASVRAQFSVLADVIDYSGSGVARVSFALDTDHSLWETQSPPFRLDVRDPLPSGKHVVYVHALASSGEEARSSVLVNVRTPCQALEDCRDGETCASGFCIPAVGMPGALGQECDWGEECASGLCEERRCVELCDLAMEQACPSGFECKPSGQARFACVHDESGWRGCAVVASGRVSPAAQRGAAFVLSATVVLISLLRFFHGGKTCAVKRS
ncbi:MAG: hypothetical protein HY698_15780 [Deltaproteobacteria bacterium]|nr:hypothetical protein [Deltaproteobacteria bacterium]